MRLLVHSAGQVVQVCSEGQRVLRGPEMDRPAVLTADRDSSGLALAVDRSESPAVTAAGQQNGNDKVNGRWQLNLTTGHLCRQTVSSVDTYSTVSIFLCKKLLQRQSYKVIFQA